MGIPLTILIGINTYFLELEHAEHLREHPHEVPAYPHLRVRNKVVKPPIATRPFPVYSHAYLEILLWGWRSHALP